MTGCDMIVNLNLLPSRKELPGIKLKRAFIGDKDTILEFVSQHFSKNWVYETEAALLSRGCFIATENGKLLGFACYDASAKAFFGPIGVAPEARKRGIGEALLLRTLEAMREDGYVYGIIGWVSDAEQFYRKTVSAEFVPNGTPEQSVYRNMISM